MCFYNAASKLPGRQSWAQMYGPQCQYMHPGNKFQGITIPALDMSKVEEFIKEFPVPHVCDMRA